MADFEYLDTIGLQHTLIKLKEAIDNIYVKKVTGKDLSTNDLTNALLTKLNLIAPGATETQINNLKTDGMTVGTISIITANGSTAYNIKVPVDSLMSDSSDNPVKNKTVKQYVDDAIASVTQIDFVVVSTLPPTGQKGKIYLVPNSGDIGNTKDEYIWITEGGVGKFEKIGSTEIDLSGYIQKVANATENNIAVLNSDGSISDSGKNISVLDEHPINDFRYIQKLENYLYKVTYDNLDKEFADEYFRTHYFNLGGCSSVRKGSLYGRNYDWYYDNTPEFIVSVPAIKGENSRHASIAVCPGLGGLTDEFVSSREYSDLYKVVPFAVLDGMNDAGLVCNINIVPAGDNGITTGTTPLIEKREELNIYTVLRFVLDNFDRVYDAVTYLRDYCSIKMINTADTKIEAHYMFADQYRTWVVEFVDNEMQIIDISNTRPYMTNFYLYGMEFDNTTGLVDRTSLTPHGSGVERYELIASKYSNINNSSDMMNLLHTDLKFTNAYDTDFSPYWYTEFVGDYETFGDVTVTSPISAFEPVVNYAVNEFNHRNRNTKTTWQTVHSIVYDMDRKSFELIPQEGNNTYKFNVDDTITINDEIVSINDTWSSNKIQSIVDEKDDDRINKDIFGWIIPKEIKVRNTVSPYSDLEFRQCIDRIDLGTLNYTYSAENKCFETTEIPYVKKSQGAAQNVYMMGWTSVYQHSSDDDMQQTSHTMSINTDAYSENKCTFRYFPNQITDPEVFKSLMQNEYLYYEKSYFSNYALNRYKNNNFLSDEWKINKPYNKGDYVTLYNCLYKCDQNNINMQPYFMGSSIYWKLVNISDELKKINDNRKSGIAGIPKIYIDGVIPTTKDNVNCDLHYVGLDQEFTSYIQIKCQGTSSMSYPKKNFTINLYQNSDRTIPQNITFFKNYSVNKYCLKANYIDHTHSRNIVCANLWSEIVASRNDYDALPWELKMSPNHGAIDGFPVLVYTNGNYQGLYTLNIPKDGWCYGMESINDGTVICAETNTDGVFKPTPCNFRHLWDGYTWGDWSVEFSDLPQEEIMTSFNNIINALNNSSYAELISTLSNYVDIQSAIDYYILQYAICGLDNLGKNMILITYDNIKWYLMPYDLDSTMGSYHNGYVDISYNYKCPEDYNESYNILFEKLEILLGDRLKERYFELRQNVLSLSNIIDKFDKFYDSIGQTLLDKDLEIYPGIPDSERNNIYQIENFAYQRLKYCDEEFAKFTARIPCNGISFSESEISITSIDPVLLTPILSPADTTDPVFYVSGDKSIVKVDNEGHVIPQRNGTTIVTVSCGDYSAEIDIVVSGVVSDFIIYDVETKDNTMIDSYGQYLDPGDEAWEGSSEYFELPENGFIEINNREGIMWCSIAFYDENYNFISHRDGFFNTSLIDLSEIPTAKKIRVSQNNQYQYRGHLFLKCGGRNLNDGIEWQTGAINWTTGAYDPTGSSTISDMIEIDGAGTLCYGNQNGGDYIWKEIALYDQNQQYMGMRSLDGGWETPIQCVLNNSNIHYVRVSLYASKTGLVLDPYTQFYIINFQ